MDYFNSDSQADEKACAEYSPEECIDCPEFADCPQRKGKFLKYLLLALLIASLAVFILSF